jgi:hypothetical protein
MSRRRNRRARRLANQLDAGVRRLEESNRRGFLWQGITALGVGWLFWSLPPPQRRAVRVAGGTRHAVNAGPVRFVFDVPRVAVTVHRGRV